MLEWSFFNVVFKIGNSIYSSTIIGTGGHVWCQTYIQWELWRAAELITLYSTFNLAIKDCWVLSWKWCFIASRRVIDQKLAVDLAVLFNSCTYTIYKSLYHFIGCARSKFINFVVHLIQICLVLTDHFYSRNCLVTYGRFLNINKSLRNPNTNRQSKKYV
jgi:hypothetical protein